MKTGRQALLFAAIFLAGSVALPGWGTGFDKSLYDVIVATKPFGEKAKSASALAAEKAPEQPKVRFSEILKVTLIRHDDVLGDACAIDDSKNPAWHAYLGVGESKDGIQIKKIDLDANGVLLGKEGQDDEWLYLGGASAPASTPRSRGSPVGAIPKSVPFPQPGIAIQPVVQLAAQSSGPTEADNVVEPPPMSGPELEKHMQDYQMDLIRSAGLSGPPLPMELTPEMDARLVIEGVLPPQ